MKTIAGVWIDHRKAVVTKIAGQDEATRVIESNVEKHAGRIDGVRSTTPYEAQKVPADDSRQREFTGHLHGYYDAIIAALGDAESILILGPGEAKGELRSRLEKDHLGGRIAAVETADKMTDRQIAAKVREYFRKESTPAP
ncbi:MAG TPA: hypothetical protein VGQ32_04755 [Thermoanaerobaculia bacterium]|jgi:hypothetical protein|nr:hypothetical protein [Thermoanaerobaculia bacterium]